MRKITYRDAIREALQEEMRADEKVIVFGEDVADPFGGSFKVTKGLSTEFGTDRVRNTPIAEAVIAGAAVGAAIAGYRPVPEIMYMDFTGCCFDAIVNQAAKTDTCQADRFRHLSHSEHSREQADLLRRSTHRAGKLYTRISRDLRLLFLQHRMMLRAC